VAQKLIRGDVDMNTTPVRKEASNAETQTQLRKALLKPFVMKKIKFEIQSLIKAQKIQAQDADDIQQEIFLELVNCLDSFNPETSALKTYISAVILKAARKAARDIWTNRQDSCQFCPSLNEPLTLSESDSENYSLSDTVSEDEVAMYLGKREHTRHEQCLIASEVQEFVSTLSNRQNSVCKELMEGKTISEIAARKKIPRSSFYRNIIIPIRKAMEKVKLHNNLPLAKNLNIL
jgi:RNA polymerase sigma factor (sigma-70 family)